jgi:hypothetical protein
MATEQVLTQYECDRAIDFMRRCSSRGEAVTWAHAVRFAKYAREDQDDEYDDRDRPHRPRTRPLRLEDDSDGDDRRDDDDSAPKPRVVKEPVVRRPRDADDDDDEDEDTGNRPARRLPENDDEDDRRTRRGRGQRRPDLDAMLERVTSQPCSNCGKTPAGSAEIKVPSKDEREDLDPDKGAYLIPLCPDCKQTADGQEAAEVEVHKRHARGGGDCNLYSRSVRLFNEARDRRDR